MMKQVAGRLSSVVRVQCRWLRHDSPAELKETGPRKARKRLGKKASALRAKQMARQRDLLQYDSVPELERIAAEVARRDPKDDPDDTPPDRFAGGGDLDLEAKHTTGRFLTAALLPGTPNVVPRHPVIYTSSAGFRNQRHIPNTSHNRWLVASHSWMSVVPRHRLLLPDGSSVPPRLLPSSFGDGPMKSSALLEDYSFDEEALREVSHKADEQNEGEEPESLSSVLHATLVNHILFHWKGLHTYPVSEGTTVGDVRKHIHHITGIPLDKLVLKLGDELLTCDGHTVSTAMTPESEGGPAPVFRWDEKHEEGAVTIPVEYYEYTVANSLHQPVPLGRIVEVRPDGGRPPGVRAWALHHSSGEWDKKVLATTFHWDSSGTVPVFDEDFWWKRLQKAHENRLTLINLKNTTGYRVVNGQNDGLPGLVVDVYGPVAVVMVDDPPPEAVQAVLSYLDEMGMEHVMVHDAKGREFVVPGSSSTTPLTLRGWKHWVKGGVESCTFHENGVRYLWDPSLVEPLFSGFFLCHRQVRHLVQSLAKDKEVLDMMAFTGSMGISALYGGASRVVFMEQEEEFCKAIERNLDLAHPEGKEQWEKVARVLCTNVIDWYADKSRREREYDLVVLDPSDLFSDPPTQSQLNFCGWYLRHALQSVRRNGLVFLLFNSQGVKMDRLSSVLRRQASNAGVHLSVIRTFSPTVDFPIDVTCMQHTCYNGLLLSVQ